MELVKFNKAELKAYAREIFPPENKYDQDGFVASGGNLTVDFLLIAYAAGIFPWYSDDSPILWWSPDPRLVLFPDDFRLSHSLKRKTRDNQLEVRWDSRFREVITACAGVNRPDQPGTWITNDMLEAYCEMHEAGFAHSVEIIRSGKLVGGLYGVSIGNAFFGESMFHLETDASKLALFHLVQRAKEWNFAFIDSQVPTDHLKSMGAVEIPRSTYLELLDRALDATTHMGTW